MADATKKLTWSELLKKLTDIEVGKPLDVEVQKETIPIVFVPGIMGSRLKRAADGKKVWDPDDKLFMLWNYGMATVDAADKKAALIGEADSGTRPRIQLQLVAPDKGKVTIGYWDALVDSLRPAAAP